MLIHRLLLGSWWCLHPSDLHSPKIRQAIRTSGQRLFLALRWRPHDLQVLIASQKCTFWSTRHEAYHLSQCLRVVVRPLPGPLLLPAKDPVVPLGSGELIKTNIQVGVRLSIPPAGNAVLPHNLRKSTRELFCHRGNYVHVDAQSSLQGLRNSPGSAPSCTNDGIDNVQKRSRLGVEDVYSQHSLLAQEAHHLRLTRPITARTLENDSHARR
mmetsp:Transcript_33446/g.78185  ORF Transcript_33446/g.78185 Transcript_33446/m.78185 type:complete len:212 (+) Transcript_33446:37-672(+)